MKISNDGLSGYLFSRGASLVGYADIGILPYDARKGFPRAVSIAVALNPEIVRGIADGPTREYAAEYDRVNDVLNGLAEDAVSYIQKHGFQAAAVISTVKKPLEELGEELRVSLPHKTVAVRAGLGWIGRCALVVTKDFGSAVRFATVLTDAPLEPGNPVKESRCGMCENCVTACPANAPSGREWKYGMDRDDFFDVWACYDRTLRINETMGWEYFICGMCIIACPWTQRYISRQEMKEREGNL